VLVHYQREHPDTYATFLRKFTDDEHNYTAAVSNNDTATASRLAPLTIFAFNVRRAMTVTGGCALV
jgi:hypothetical protein